MRLNCVHVYFAFGVKLTGIMQKSLKMLQTQTGILRNQTNTHQSPARYTYINTKHIDPHYVSASVYACTNNNRIF